jgi:DNA replication and repair protein RecF
LAFEPAPAVNVLLGENGSGKSSVLEAIAYAATGKSFRRSPDAALVRVGAETGIVRVGVEGASSEAKIEISIPANGRRHVLINGKRPKENAELSRILPVVAFLPDDLELVKGGPGLRRDFLDELAAQLLPQAGAAQGEFSRALRQRNTLLRQEGRRADPLTLSVWDERVASAGGEVLAHRLDLLDQLGPVLQSSYDEVEPG